MDYKRLTLFAGHYGSGKTNIAVSYSLHLAKMGLPVTGTRL
jgi:DNA replication protein DnaC